jgi:aminopeptidase N
MRILFLFPVLLLASFVAAQRFDAERPPNTYRNADNPHYWKNRPPHPGYWQQDVHYVIKGRLDDEQDLIEGDLTLYYHNNSGDTLRHVFFHLYQEAYTPGSYADLLDNDGRPHHPARIIPAPGSPLSRTARTPCVRSRTTRC